MGKNERLLGIILGVVFVFGLLLLTGCQPRVEEKIPRTYICHRAVSEIKIDGVLDEADWEKAEPLKFLHLSKEEQKYEDALSPAFAKFLYDGDNLYIGIEAKDKDIWATLKEHDSVLCREDVLEAFLKPDKDKPAYFEFEFSPKNVTWDMLWPRRRARSDRAASVFESDLKSAVKVYGTLNNWKDTDDRWVLEVAIPFSSFNEVSSPPETGDEWAFSLCRYDYSVYLDEGLEYSSTAKLSKIWFHLWEDYDVLLFQK